MPTETTHSLQQTVTKSSTLQPMTCLSGVDSEQTICLTSVPGGSPLTSQFRIKKNLLNILGQFYIFPEKKQAFFTMIEKNRRNQVGIWQPIRRGQCGLPRSSNAGRYMHHGQPAALERSAEPVFVERIDIKGVPLHTGGIVMNLP